MSATPLCHGCRSSTVESELFAVALGGDLVQYCPRCFYCREIAELSARLPAGHSVKEIATDGLGELYTLVKAAVEEELATQSGPWTCGATSTCHRQDASETEREGRRTRRRREGQGESGRGESQGYGSCA